MGVRAGLALKTLQWFIRGVQFCCAGLVLAIYSYFLATLHNHGLEIATWIRAVEGISGVATLYAAAGLALLCCVAGHPVTSFLALVLDVSFIGGFIYVAQANGGGAGSCTGEVRTPFGTGDSETTVVDDGHGGFTSLPKLRQACQLESACLAVSIVIIFFYIFSILVEIRLARFRSKEKRFGPSPANDYTSGSGATVGTGGGGLMNWIRRKSTRRHHVDNTLPEHTHPDELPGLRHSYATETTAVGEQPSSPMFANKYGDQPASPTYANKYGEPGAYGAPAGVGAGIGRGGYGRVDTASRDGGGYGNPYAQQGETHPPPPNYRYGDGVYERV